VTAWGKGAAIPRGNRLAQVSSCPTMAACELQVTWHAAYGSPVSITRPDVCSCRMCLTSISSQQIQTSACSQPVIMASKCIPYGHMGA
jgi:hypothetical protein